MSKVPDRGLIAAGALLFLGGLLAGFAVPAVSNPRMGLSGHLEGLMNGTFLMFVGLAWPRVRLGRPAARLCAAALLVGAWGNWLVVQFAAVAGTRSMTPIAGTQAGAAPWQEQLVSAGLLLVAAAMALGVGLLVAGLLRPEAESEGDPPRGSRPSS